MASEPLIRANVLANLAALLSEYGLAPAALPGLGDLVPEGAGEAALISVRRYMELLVRCAEETRDPLFALKLGLRMRSTTSARWGSSRRTSRPCAPRSGVSRSISGASSREPRSASKRSGRGLSVSPIAWANAFPAGSKPTSI